MEMKRIESEPKGIHVPRSMLFQWHVTERCNLRCAHCYQDSYTGSELPYEDLIRIMHQFRQALAYWRKRSGGRRISGHITLTGGEPFVRYDFLKLLRAVASYRRCFSFAILTNGSLIDTKLARQLRILEPAFVQVSIEGGKHTHDRIRGAGNYDKTVLAIIALVKAGVRTLISFTAHRNNYWEFPEVAELGRRLRVSRVWADRLIPSGNGRDLRDQVLAPHETREFLEIMNKVRQRFQKRWFNRTEISMARALQFLTAGGRPYRCTAGDTLLTVQANGELVPCRRMPIRIGNLMNTSLVDLYYGSELLGSLRGRDVIPQGCRDCSYSRYCRGGLKCLSYALTGDAFTRDPGCWKSLQQDSTIGSELQSATRKISLYPESESVL